MFVEVPEGLGGVPPRPDRAPGQRQHHRPRPGRAHDHLLPGRQHPRLSRTRTSRSTAAASRSASRSTATPRRSRGRAPTATSRRCPRCRSSFRAWSPTRAPARPPINRVAEWNGLGVGLNNLWRLADAETRSISPENFTGEKGGGGRATEGTGAAVPPATSAPVGRSRRRSASPRARRS